MSYCSLHTTYYTLHKTIPCCLSLPYEYPPIAITYGTYRVNISHRLCSLLCITLLHIQLRETRESDGLKIEIWTKDDENVPVSTIITTTAFFDGGKKELPTRKSNIRSACYCYYCCFCHWCGAAAVAASASASAVGGIVDGLQLYAWMIEQILNLISQYILYILEMFLTVFFWACC